MIEFEKELEKFKPIMEVGHLEDNIGNGEIKDLIDMIKISKQVNEQGK